MQKFLVQGKYWTKLLIGQAEDIINAHQGIQPTGAS